MVGGSCMVEGGNPFLWAKLDMRGARHRIQNSLISLCC